MCHWINIVQIYIKTSDKYKEKLLQFLKGYYSIESLDRLEIKDQKKLIFFIEEEIALDDVHTFIEFCIKGTQTTQAVFFNDSVTDTSVFFDVNYKKINAQGDIYSDSFELSKIKYCSLSEYKSNDNILNFFPIPNRAKVSDRPILFLDRDGVLIQDKNYLFEADQVEIFPSILPLLKWAMNHNFYIVIVTNQSGVARGMFSEDDVQKVNNFIIEEFKSAGAVIDDVFYAPCHIEGKISEYKKKSYLRKPECAMVLKSLEKYPATMKKMIMIGDSESDEINHPFLKTYLIDRGKDYSNTSANLCKNYDEMLKKIQQLYKNW